MKHLLVATRNPGKLNEYRQLLDDLPDVTWYSLADVGLDDMEVAETGTTFAENARLKAHAYMQAAGLITLADDSGLVVDALDGAPGVYSARYGKPQVTTAEGRYQLLLDNLADVPPADRTARFVCVIAIALPGQSMDEVAVVEGTIEGRIGYNPRGDNGFGYDPVFELPDGRTLAELPSEEKNPISHRGRALQKAEPLLRDYLR